MRILFFMAIVALISSQKLGNTDLFSCQNMEIENQYNLDCAYSNAIYYFLHNDFHSATRFFTEILDQVDPTCKCSSTLYAAALWGRLLCSAYMNSDSLYSDLGLIREQYIENTNYCVATSNSHYFQLAAEFSDPSEKLTPQQCKERVFGVAQAMRTLTLGIPNRKAAAAVNICIAELEHKAYQCCERNHWSECLNPIVDAWEYLKKSLENGVKLSPRVLLPHR